MRHIVRATHREEIQLSEVHEETHLRRLEELLYLLRVVEPVVFVVVLREVVDYHSNQVDVLAAEELQRHRG